MIPEWLSFRNEFCSRVKFVLHTHDKINQPIPRRSLARQIRYACATFPTLNGLQFSIRKKVHFHDIVMKREFHSEQKAGMTWREGNVVSLLLFGKQIQRNMRKWNELVSEWKYFRHHLTVAPTMWPFCMTSLDVTWPQKNDLAIISAVYIYFCLWCCYVYILIFPHEENFIYYPAVFYWIKWKCSIGELFILA